MNKLHHTLLIDDNEADNFLHRKVINRTCDAESVIEKTTAEAALNYLAEIKSIAELPQLIFLDLNMPGMDGWEFLEELSRLEHCVADNTGVYILTTSLNDADKDKAAGLSLINGYITKPLTVDLLEQIIKEHHLG